MINSIKISNIYGLTTPDAIDLEQVVLLVGKNGAGKSRFLKLINDKFSGVDKLDGFEINSNDKDFGKYKIANYSHCDILLQSPGIFLPDVIAEAVTRLEDGNYENTATDALLFIYDMAFGYSDYCKKQRDIFERFQKYAEQFELKIEKNETERKVFVCGDGGGNEKPLSPGQRYLLRMAVASFRQELTDIEKGQSCDSYFIFLIDEPETHLHPDALINVLDVLIRNFKNKAQFFIATHSFALTAHFVVSALTDTLVKILWFENGKIENFRSNSTKLINGLIGNENNRSAINNLICLPEDFACNIFATQCLNEPKSESINNKIRQDGTSSSANDALSINLIVLDYGVGKGRFLESLKIFDPNKLKNIDYYAYDKSPDDSEKCKNIMNVCFGNTKGYKLNEHYFNDYKQCLSVLKNVGKPDLVLMINVLHEIPVSEWKKTFRNVCDALNNTGKLVIVEREELTIGEAPYINGYVMLTESGAKSLFGDEAIINRGNKPSLEPETQCGADCEKVNQPGYGHILNSPIIRYVANKKMLRDIDLSKIIRCLSDMEQEAKTKIRTIHIKHREQEKSKNIDENWRFKNGISLAFWAHQYANVNLNLDELKEIDVNR